MPDLVVHASGTGDHRRLEFVRKFRNFQIDLRMKLFWFYLLNVGTVEASARQAVFGKYEDACSAFTQFATILGELLFSAMGSVLRQVASIITLCGEVYENSNTLTRVMVDAAVLYAIWKICLIVWTNCL